MDRKTQMSASDVVYALSAILENPKSVAKLLSPTEDEETCSPAEVLTENFWTAFDLLTFKDLKTLGFGLEQAKMFQEEILSMAKALMKEGKIKTTHLFRYVTIDRETDFFTKPQTLTRLGLYLIEAKKTHAGSETKPVIISVKSEEKDCYMVAGIMGVESFVGEEIKTNTFGQAFGQAAESIGAEPSYTGFDTSIVEIESVKFKQFLNELIKY